MGGANNMTTCKPITMIYNEPCLDTLSRMEDNSVDVVVTSPPYNMNLRIRKGKYCSRQIVDEEFATKYNNFSDNLPLEEYNKLHTNILRELLRVSELIFYNVQLVTGSKRSVFKMIGEFSDNLKEIIIWDKGYAPPAMHPQVLNRVSELILVFDTDYPISRKFSSKGRFERGTLNDIWRIKRSRSKNKKHSAVFPEELVETILLNFSDEGDTIYDPFMGTGTTGVVAQRLGRKFIGSEISSEYVQTADERMENLDDNKTYTH